MSLKKPKTTRLGTTTVGAALIATLLLAFAGPSFAKKGGNGGGNGGGGNGGGDDPPPPEPPPMVFSVTVLSDFDADDGRPSVRAINDWGDVVGESLGFDATLGEYVGGAVMWPAGSTVPVDLNDLNPQTGWWLSEANDINNLGQVVGEVWARDPATGPLTDDTEFGAERAFRLTLGPDANSTVFEHFGTLGGSGSEASGVNDFGEVTGYSYTGEDGVIHGFAYTDAAGMIDIGTFGGRLSDARAINNLGQITGEADYADQRRAFRYSIDDGSMLDLGTLGKRNQYSPSRGNGINDQGHVVGVSDIGGWYKDHAFVWRPATGMVDLGTLGGDISEAFSINNNGLIVGTSTTESLNGPQSPVNLPRSAFLYIDGTMYPLLKEVSDGGLIADGALPAGWGNVTNSFARDINDANQICGEVTYSDGSGYGFVLTPIAP